MNSILNAYYKKTIAFKQGDLRLQFKLSHELFASQEVDHGVQRLLRTLLFEKVDSYTKVLDLGCGYGPLGITLKAMRPSAQVQMVESDALALEFARENVLLNDVGPIQVSSSLGFDGVTDTDFDLIVSNIPADISGSVLEHLIQSARLHLAPGGRVVFVAVDEIANLIHELFKLDESIERLAYKKWPGHHVYHFSFKERAALAEPEVVPSGFEAGLLVRDEATFEHNGKKFKLDLSYSLPEFEVLDYDTELLLNFYARVKSSPQKIVCLNPGQGHFAVAAYDQFAPHELHLIDRNLVSLYTAEHNLKLQQAQVETHHQIGVLIETKEVDLVIGRLPEKQELIVNEVYMEELASILKPGGLVIFVSSSTSIARLYEAVSKSKSLEVLQRDRSESRGLLYFRRMLDGR